jgi:hypothetical protein
VRTLVSSYSGYHLTDMEPGEIRGLPSRSLTLIVALDEPISIVSMPDRRLPSGSFWSMIGGLHTSPAVIGHRGRQHGVQARVRRIEPWAMASRGTPIRSRRAVLRGPDSVT